MPCTVLDTHDIAMIKRGPNLVNRHINKNKSVLKKNKAGQGHRELYLGGNTGLNHMKATQAFN